MKKLKPIPEFKNEDEEFEFWSTCDFTEYLDPKGWKRHSSAEEHSLNETFRIPPEMVPQVQRLSRERKIDVQELVRQLLAAGLKQQRPQPGA